MRVSGWLLETGEFRPGIGWETQRVRQRPLDNSDIKVSLIGEGETQLVSRPAEVRTTICGGAAVTAGSRVRVVAYLPLLEEASAVVIRAGDRVIHRAELASRPPTVSVDRAEVVDESLNVLWSAEHDRPLWFNVFVSDARKRTILVGSGLTTNGLTVDIATLPGGPECSVAVLATDGYRSEIARSDPLELPARPPVATILGPAAGDLLTPDHPVSLLGSARDAAGEVLPEEGLVWVVDGETVAEGTQLTVIKPLSPGAHTIALRWNRDAEAVVSVTVADRTPEQEAWLRLVGAEL